MASCYAPTNWFTVAFRANNTAVSTQLCISAPDRYAPRACHSIRYFIWSHIPRSRTWCLDLAQESTFVFGLLGLAFRFYHYQWGTHACIARSVSQKIRSDSVVPSHDIIMFWKYFFKPCVFDNLCYILLFEYKAQAILLLHSLSIWISACKAP